MRAVLAHHFIFHANRVGLPAADQAPLAALAVDTVSNTAERPDSSSLIHMHLNRLLGDMRSERMVRALAADLLAIPS